MGIPVDLRCVSSAPMTCAACCRGGNTRFEDAPMASAAMCWGGIRVLVGERVSNISYGESEPEPGAMPRLRDGWGSAETARIMCIMGL